jgi:hypothetical protein
MEVLGANPSSAPLYPPQIVHGLTETTLFAERHRQLTAWPIVCPVWTFINFITKEEMSRGMLAFRIFCISVSNNTETKMCEIFIVHLMLYVCETRSITRGKNIVTWGKGGAVYIWTWGKLSDRKMEKRAYWGAIWFGIYNALIIQSVPNHWQYWNKHRQLYTYKYRHSQNVTY